MMDAKYNVLDICRYVIHSSWEENTIISNLRLQKLLYFVQAMFFIEYDYPCFREDFEAWEFGPVVPEAYHAYSIYCSACIPDQDIDDLEISEQHKKLIDGVIRYFREKTAIDLVYLSHAQSPWRDTYKKGVKNILISKEKIRDYFRAGM